MTQVSLAPRSQSRRRNPFSGVAEAASAPPPLPAEAPLLYPAVFLLLRTPHPPPDSRGDQTHPDAHAVSRRPGEGREPSLRALRRAEGRAQAAQNLRSGEPRQLRALGTLLSYASGVVPALSSHGLVVCRL